MDYQDGHMSMALVILYNAEDFDTGLYTWGATYGWRTFFNFIYQTFVGPALTIDLGCQSLINYVRVRPSIGGDWRGYWVKALRVTLSRDDETYTDLAAVHDMGDFRTVEFYRDIPLIYVAPFGLIHRHIGRFVHLIFLEVEAPTWATLNYLDVETESQFCQQEKKCPTGFTKILDGCFRRIKGVRFQSATKT